VDPKIQTPYREARAQEATQAEAASDWSHRVERLASLKKIETQLQHTG
jgi:hypothetical protein